jgi:hypothetical protein
VEKFEAHVTTAAYAIVLVTPDDVGWVGGTILPQASPAPAKMCCLLKGALIADRRTRCYLWFVQRHAATTKPQVKYCGGPNVSA